jgi:Flp pilus assembly protein TadG
MTRIAFKQNLARFQRDEDGAIIVLTLMLFILMIMMGGIAVDIMRCEDAHATLQQTLGRSILAAAAMEHELDTTSVVEDYMDAVALADALDGVMIA